MALQTNTRRGHAACFPRSTRLVRTTRFLHSRLFLRAERHGGAPAARVAELAGVWLPPHAPPKMNALADAVIAALSYISTAPANDDREDDDVRALESVCAILHRCSSSERDALRTALSRARAAAALSPSPGPDLLDTLRAIETEILDIESA